MGHWMLLPRQPLELTRGESDLLAHSEFIAVANANRQKVKKKSNRKEDMRDCKSRNNIGAMQ